MNFNDGAFCILLILIDEFELDKEFRQKGQLSLDGTYNLSKDKC